MVHSIYLLASAPRLHTHETQRLVMVPWCDSSSAAVCCRREFPFLLSRLTTRSAKSCIFLSLTLSLSIFPSLLLSFSLCLILSVSLMITVLPPLIRNSNLPDYLLDLQFPLIFKSSSSVFFSSVKEEKVEGVGMESAVAAPRQYRLRP